IRSPESRNRDVKESVSGRGAQRVERKEIRRRRLFGLRSCRSAEISWQASGLLVLVNSGSSDIHPCISSLSTWWSTTSLTGSTHLRSGFPLRCIQRLSLPTVATQRCRWRDNWYTRGWSNPVLSYYGQIPSILLRPHQIGTELSR